MPTLPLIAGILQNIAAVRPLYLVIWSALVALSVFIIISMRTHWGRARPMYRCAALSLLVHFVLIGLAMTVKLVVGDGGKGFGPPIRVRVYEEVARPGSLDANAPARLYADDGAAIETAAEELPPIEPPPLLPPPNLIAAEVAVDEAPADSNTAPPLIVDDGPAAAAPESAVPTNNSQRLTDAVVTGDQPAPSARLASRMPPAATSPYARRNITDHLRWAEEQGGSRQTEAAVTAALEWLAKSQSPDGRWDASQFGAGVEMQVLGQNRGGAGADADPGITALALLAFLGAGHTQDEGDYQSTVRNGLDFLVRSQGADGNLASGSGLYAQMYCHSMATFALAEAFAVTGDKQLEPAVRRAVNYCLRAQNPATGGWRYRIGDLGDTSQLGWQLMALWSAERGGMKIPPQTWTGAERFLRSVRRGRDGGLASYRPDGPASTPMTAEALYCRHLVGEMIGNAGDDVATIEATNQLLATLPDSSRINLYYWYYGTLALHYQQQSSDEAANAWKSWNESLTTVLLKEQQTDGSWNPSCIWGGYGGRVYTTSISALCLEVYYRYAPPAVQNDWTASRPEAVPGGRGF